MINKWARGSTSGHHQMYPRCDSFKMLLAQAGSSIFLVGFLFLVKTTLLALLSSHDSGLIPGHGHTGAPSYSHPDTARILPRSDLMASLQLLENDADCASLLKCLDFGLEVNVEDPEEFTSCKTSFIQCKSRGLLHHLYKILEAIDEVG
jgi:hypothetical protein